MVRIRKIPVCLLGTLRLLFLAGLAATVLFGLTVKTYMPKDVNLAPYQTYSWLPGRSSTPQGMVENPQSTPFVHSAVDVEMKAKGLRLVEADGDLQIEFLAAQGASFQTLGFGVPGSYWTSWTVHVQNQTIASGTLAINVFDRRTQKSVFVATCSDTIDNAGQLEKKVKKAVVKAFKKMPAAR
jgi:hypothetical protein